MSSNVEKLLVIQDRDRKIRRLEQEIKDLPKRKQLIEAQLDAFRKAHDEAEDAIRKKSLEQKDLEAQIEQRQERIRKFRQQQFEVKNNDDYRAFEHQIATLNQEISDVEDRDLVLMEEIEGLQKIRDEKLASLKDEEKVVAGELELFQQRSDNIARELEEVQQNRAELARDVDPTWLQRYDRIFQHVGDYALVEVENNTCGGCHMKLPPQAAHDARRLDDMTLCMYCGRLLYYIP